MAGERASEQELASPQQHPEQQAAVPGPAAETTPSETDEATGESALDAVAQWQQSEGRAAKGEEVEPAEQPAAEPQAENARAIGQISLSTQPSSTQRAEQQQPAGKEAETARKPSAEPKGTEQEQSICPEALAAAPVASRNASARLALTHHQTALGNLTQGSVFSIEEISSDSFLADKRRRSHERHEQRRQGRSEQRARMAIYAELAQAEPLASDKSRRTPSVRFSVPTAAPTRLKRSRSAGRVARARRAESSAPSSSLLSSAS